MNSFYRILDVLNAEERQHISDVFNALERKSTYDGITYEQAIQLVTQELRTMRELES